MKKEPVDAKKAAANDKEKATRKIRKPRRETLALAPSDTHVAIESCMNPAVLNQTNAGFDTRVLLLPLEVWKSDAPTLRDVIRATLVGRNRETSQKKAVNYLKSLPSLKQVG